MSQSHHSLAQAASETAPIMVEVMRGDDVESQHRAIIAVVGADGTVHETWGNANLAIFPRSSIKPIQAMPLIMSGAADAFGLGDAELAIACGSHNGEPGHVQLVEAWLKKLGCTPDDLGCGGHLPYHPPSAEALLREGKPHSRLHDNCSGKHAGFLTLARHLGAPIQGYLKPDHPVQQEVTKAMTFMTDFSPMPTACGIDGCGIPAYAFPVQALAYGIARFARPEALPPDYAAAAQRLTAAIMNEPWYVAGSGRFDTVAMTELHHRFIVKAGAEGVFMAMFPSKSLGLALKVLDGAARAAEILMAGLIRRIEGINPGAYPDFNLFTTLVLRTRTGEPTGTIRLASTSGI